MLNMKLTKTLTQQPVKKVFQLIKYIFNSTIRFHHNQVFTKIKVYIGPKYEINFFLFGKIIDGNFNDKNQVNVFFHLDKINVLKYTSYYEI